MSEGGESHSGSGQPSADSEWRQYLASSPIRGIDGLGGGWIVGDEVTSSLPPQEPEEDPEEEPEEDPEEEPKEDPEEEPEEDPEEDPEEEPEEEPPEEPMEVPEEEPEEDPEQPLAVQIPEAIQEEVQELEHQDDQHIGPEDFEEDLEDWDDHLDDLEVGDEELAWSDEEPESGLDEEPMPVIPPRPTRYYSGKFYVGQHQHAPLQTFPGDPYFSDMGYDDPPPVKRARVESEIPQFRQEDMEQLLQAVNRLHEELQRAREGKGLFSSLWDWFRRRF